MAASQRIGKDPKQIKALSQECWSLNKTQSAFAHALKEHGYVLARGDWGEVFAVSKWVGIKTKEMRERLIDEARIRIAKDMTAKLETLSQEQNSVFEARRTELEEKRQILIHQHRSTGYACCINRRNTDGI